MNELERWSDDMAAELTQDSGQGFDIVGMIKRRKWWMIVFSVLGLAGGYAYYTLAPPIYESWAQLMVIQKQADPPTLPQYMRRNGGEYIVQGDDLATQAELLVSVQTLSKAMQDSKLEELSIFRDVDQPLMTLVDNLSVAVGGRENADAAVVNLSFRSKSPEDSREVITAIVEAYRQQLSQTFQREGDEMLARITEARENLRNDLRTLNEKFKEEKSKNATVSLMRETGNSGMLALSEAKVLNLEKQIAELQAANVKTKAHRDQLLLALNEGGLDPKAAYQFMYRMTKFGSLAEEKTNELKAQRLFDLESQLSVNMEKFGSKHPEVIHLQEMIKSLKESATGIDEGEEEEVGEDGRQMEAVMTYLKTLDHEVMEQEQQIAELIKLNSQEKANLQEIVNIQTGLDNIRHEMDQVNDLYDAVVRRIKEMDLMSYGGMTAQVITSPAYGIQVAPKLFFALLMGGGFGFATGFGLGFLMEKADKSFRSPEQIRRELGLPVIGHIPVIMAHDEIGETAETLDPILCTYYLPRSRYAEAYRAVRTALYFSTQYRDHNVIQITGANRDDGKSTLAANLAICIAQSGKRVLLVDADFRRPTISKLFGLPNDIGLSSVIKGVAEVPDVTQRTPVENLSVMVCGPKPTNPAELLTSPRFKELIDMLRDQYDFVIFDSPPLLAVTDASVIAARVDGVLLGLQITKRGRPAAVEATEKLDAIGAKILGVVVNGIGWKRAYAYRYGGNFGAQSRFYQVGTEMDIDGQGYIYGETLESEVSDAERRGEPPVLAAPAGDGREDVS